MGNALVQSALAHKGEPYHYPISVGGFDCSRLVRATVGTVGQWAPALVTIPNVELLETGEDWETSTGLFTWDEADLNSAVESQGDPSIRTPVIKLGHVDPRFDGQPAFGRIENMRVDNNGQTLIGDLVGVPVWLAQIMPTAYPRRSIEGYFDYCSPGPAGTTKWPFVLTGLALLGDAYPAINTLEDLQILWGQEPPPLEPVEDVVELVAASDNGYVRAMRRTDMVSWLKTRRGEEVAAAAPSGQVQAASSIDDVRRAFYDQLESGQYWWWIRQVLVNPFQLVVDDDEGGLYLIDVTVDAGDNITFGEPQSVKVEYVAATASGLAEVHKRGQIVCASWGDRVAAGAKDKEEEGAQGDLPDSTEEERDVLTDDALRALGLEPGATTEQINAAILARAQGGDGDGGGDGTVTTEPGAGNEPTAPTTQPTTPATDPAAQPVTAPTPTPTTDTTVPAAPAPALTLPPGTVLVDQEQWAQTQQGVAAALRIEQQQREQARDSALNAAVMAGKFPPARIEHYRNLWNADPEGTKVMLSSMADGLVPVTERGVAGETDPKPTESAYPESWMRDPRVVAARNAVSTRVKVVND